MVDIIDPNGLVKEAIAILKVLGLPKQQLNERSGLSLLALLDIGPNGKWKDATDKLIGVTPIMDWCRDKYSAHYAPNSRETFRRKTLHQFIEAGICLYNPDKPNRAVNSPAAVYQIEQNILKLLRCNDNKIEFNKLLSDYLLLKPTLSEKYAKERDMNLIPVILPNGMELKLSAGEHSELIKQIITEFGPRYAPGGQLVYVGDTGNKKDYFNKDLLKSLNIVLDGHGKLPDVVIHFTEKNWILLIESVTSHGPIDHKRYEELATLFKDCSAGIVYVSAFPNRKIFLRYLEVIAWETEVWIADSPTHMIHLNGSRFLGPYDS